MEREARKTGSAILSRVARSLTDKVAFSILLAGIGALLIGKLLAVAAFIPRDQTIYDLGFGIGRCLQSMSLHGRFADCIETWCARASKMPFAPLFFYGIGFLSIDQRTAGYIKALSMSAAFLPLFVYLLRVNRTFSRHALQCWSVIGVVLFFSPPVMKHAGALTYEEGILLEVLLLWSYSYLLLILSYSHSTSRRQSRILAILTIALALFAFMTKSSMLLIFVLSAITVWFIALRHRDLGTGLALVLSISMVVGWGLRNQFVTGHFSIMTSVDGNNLFRGWNSDSARVYPDILLDRIFDSRIAYLANGTAVSLQTTLPHESSWNEWDWDRYFKNRAMQWASDHRWEGLSFSARKLYWFLMAVRKTPYTYTNDARTALRPSLELFVTDGWLLAGRCLELVLLALLWMLWRTGAPSTRCLALAAIAVCVAYATPYLIGFGYERHVTVFLVIVGVCCAVLGAQFWSYWETRATP